MNNFKNILDCYPEYETNIGIEIHVQLKTKSKIFCSCPNQFGIKPNKNVCPICAGYPGVLPLLNKKVIDFAIMLGIATKSNITKISDFARKHYMYPDLPKNFQITQDRRPICEKGHIFIDLPNETEKKIRLIRIHIEEDAGKNIHASKTESFVDLNRAGTPLLEIVSYPDLSNSLETKKYLTQLKSIIQYLDISDANMEKGSFRSDVNISVKKKNAIKLGNKVELKNINSFKFIAQAIDYEIERQIKLIENNEIIKQETRSWNEKQHKTVFMRSKEEIDDYRHFIEPDLPRIVIDTEWIERLNSKIPELPHQKYKRFQKEYELTKDEADILTNQYDLAIFFEKTVNLCKKPKLVSNWILRNLLSYLKEKKVELNKCKISQETLAELIIEISKGIINTKVAQDIFLEMANTGKYPSIIIQEKGLKQINSLEDLKQIIVNVIKKHPEQVEKYK